MVEASASLLPPVRYMVIGMVFLGILFNNVLRGNINLAIVAMVNNTALPTNNISRADECGGNSTLFAQRSAPQPEGPFLWNEFIISQVLGAFFYGYVSTQLLGGRLAEAFSSKHAFGVSMVLSAVLTLLVPMSAWLDWRALVAVRAVMGAASGVAFPACYVLLSAWAPVDERNFLTSLVLSGSDFGIVVALPMTSTIIEWRGWEAVFYVHASFMFIWFLLWMLIATSTPQEHWFISSHELKSVTSGTGLPASIAPPVPWRSIFCSGPVWAYFIFCFGNMFKYYTLQADLSQYFSTVLGEDISSNALFNSLPYLGVWVFSALYGRVSDLLVKRQTVQLITVRRTAVVISVLVPSILLVAITCLDCNTSAVKTLLTITLVLQGASYSLSVMPLDMASNFSGTLVGLANSVDAASGFLGPLVVAALTDGRPNLASWRIVFLVVAAVAGFGGFVLLVGGSVEEQAWNRPKEEEERTADSEHSQSTGS